MKIFALLFAAACVAGAQSRHPFEVRSETSEIIADLEMSAVGTDWGVAGREAVVAAVDIDGKFSQHVMLFAGPAKQTYKVFLGRLTPGRHQLTIQKNPEHSAKTGGPLEVHNVKVEELTTTHPEYLIVAKAPVLFARKNTIGEFSDVPLIAYCERLKEGGQPLLQYTVIFSNEDGGTSTRALMARWGRTTDIEYLYKAFLNPSGEVEKATIQSREHAEIPYAGQYWGSHPMLLPVTQNNMVAPEEPTPVRYQLRPMLVDLSSHSREQVMDDLPITYQVMAKEMVREQKLRQYGVVENEKISDPRNYLYVEFNSTNKDAAVEVHVRLKGNSSVQSSSLGRIDYAISRPGWVRTTVELRPGTKANQIAELSLYCIVAPPERGQPVARAGTCNVHKVSKAFLLDESGLPGPNLIKGDLSGTLATGTGLVYKFD